MCGPALFFYANGNLLFHGCEIKDGENYGEFVNFPHSHYKIWENNYLKNYGVDFDYYPRGRVVYRKTDDTFLIYYDKCMESAISEVTLKYHGEKFILDYDEHYQCHNCNEDYVV